MTSSKDPQSDTEGARYEYRVWGQHKKARKMLSSLATSEVIEEVRDCYFLLDEPEMNAKVRNNTLKVKRLLERKRGFERWVSKRHRRAESAPAPYDELFEDLRLDRPRRGKSYDLSRAVSELDPEMAANAVFVSKRRVRYEVGSVRAEVTDMTIDDTGEVLRCLAIEGENLDDLVALRKKLGLRDSENVAVHVAIDNDR